MLIYVIFRIYLHKFNITTYKIKQAIKQPNPFSSEPKPNQTLSVDKVT